MSLWGAGWGRCVLAALRLCALELEVIRHVWRAWRQQRTYKAAASRAPLASSAGDRVVSSTGVWGAAPLGVIPSLTRLAPSARGVTAMAFTESFPLAVAIHMLGVSIAWNGGEGSTLQLPSYEQDSGSPAVGSAEAIQQSKMRLSLFCLPHPRLGKSRAYFN